MITQTAKLLCLFIFSYSEYDFAEDPANLHLMGTVAYNTYKFRGRFIL